MRNIPKKLHKGNIVKFGGGKGKIIKVSSHGIATVLSDNGHVAKGKDINGLLHIKDSKKELELNKNDPDYETKKRILNRIKNTLEDYPDKEWTFSKLCRPNEDEIRKFMGKDNIFSEIIKKICSKARISI